MKESDLKRIGTARKYPLGTRYVDKYGRPWIYIKWESNRKESK